MKELADILFTIDADTRPMIKQNYCAIGLLSNFCSKDDIDTIIYIKFPVRLLVKLGPQFPFLLLTGDLMGAIFWRLHNLGLRVTADVARERYPPYPKAVIADQRPK